MHRQLQPKDPPPSMLPSVCYPTPSLCDAHPGGVDNRHNSLPLNIYHHLSCCPLTEKIAHRTKTTLGIARNLKSTTMTSKTQLCKASPAEHYWALQCTAISRAHEEAVRKLLLSFSNGVLCAFCLPEIDDLGSLIEKQYLVPATPKMLGVTASHALKRTSCNLRLRSATNYDSNHHISSYNATAPLFT